MKLKDILVEIQQRAAVGYDWVALGRLHLQTKKALARRGFSFDVTDCIFWRQP